MCAHVTHHTSHITHHTTSHITHQHFNVHIKHHVTYRTQFMHVPFPLSVNVSCRHTSTFQRAKLSEISLYNLVCSEVASVAAGFAIRFVGCLVVFSAAGLAFDSVLFLQN